MIKGRVSGNDACILLEVKGSRGQSIKIEAVLETGFTDSLSLSPLQVARLGLRWSNFGRAVLADGAICSFDIYDAIVVWDGRAVKVVVNELDADPLVGMTLLKGHRLTMDVHHGGKLTIRKLKKPPKRRKS